MAEYHFSRSKRGQRAVPHAVEVVGKESDVTGKIMTALEELERGAGSNIKKHQRRLQSAIRRNSRPPGKDSEEGHDDEE